MNRARHPMSRRQAIALFTALSLSLATLPLAGRAFADTAAFKEAFAMYGELAASNANFKTFYDSFLPYWKKEQLWFRIAELPFDAFNAQAYQQVK